MKRTSLFFILIFHFISSSFAQQNDSLQQLLDTKKDTAKVNLLNDWCRNSFQTGKYAMAMNYGERALEEAQKLNYLKGIGSALYNIGRVHLLQGNYAKSLEIYIQALKTYDEMKDTSVATQRNINRIFNSIGSIYFLQNNYEQSLAYYQKALKVSEQINNQSGIALNCLGIGNVFYNQKDYDQALKYYLRSLHIF